MSPSVSSRSPIGPGRVPTVHPADVVRPRASPAASPRLTEVVLNLRVTLPLIAGSETRCASTWDNQDAQGLKERD